MKTGELRCAIMTVESERTVYAMHKNRRIEPKFEQMTVKKKLEVRGIHKKRKIELE